MADPDLNESAWQRAIASARGVYPSTEFEVAAALMTIIAGSIAAVASASGDTTTQIAIPILGGAVALLMTFVVVLAFELVAAPIRQRNDLRRAWSVPEVKTVNIGLTLRNLHRKGGELTHRGTSMGISRRDEMKMEEWADGVVDFLVAHVPEDLAQAFIAAGAAEAAAGRRLQAQLNALQQIIDDLGSD